MNKIIKTVAAGLILGSASVASAIPVLSIVPNGAPTVGDPVALNVQVDGLDGEWIGAYDLSLGWDPMLLSLSSVGFGSFLDGPADSIAGYDAGAGFLSIFEVSLGFLANQNGFDGFSLFSLTFAPLGSGVASVVFVPTGFQVLSNELGEAYSDFGRVGIEVPVSPPVSVPEPSSLALLLAGVVAVFGSRWSRGRQRANTAHSMAFCG